MNFSMIGCDFSGSCFGIFICSNLIEMIISHKMAAKIGTMNSETGQAFLLTSFCITNRLQTTSYQFQILNSSIS